MNVASGVDEWLQGLGLGEFKPAFAGQAIDVDALPSLTEAHLREMGIPIGPRVKLLRAIARLSLDAEVSDMVERRRLTVMFADLVGSTQLSTGLDPEDMREVIRSVHGAINVEVARYDAYVAQYKGDGALVYFGYPKAHEDDAERAVRAARAIVRTVKNLQTPTGVPLSVHVGIATGLAVVGDTFGQADAREKSAIGETPNLAARLVDVAQGGEVVVSQQTYELTRHQFEYTKLDSRLLKGIRESVSAYSVLVEKRNETLFDSRHLVAPLQMVGRSGELDLLTRCWDRARNGNGQVVFISGEAGIGKSRLVRALGQSLTAQVHARINHQCSPHYTGSALYPMSRRIARAADLQSDDLPGQQLEKLQKTLSDASTEELLLTAALLDVDAGPLGRKLEMSPLEQRHQTFQALIHQIERTASRQPVLWLLEDAHWIDPSSLEFVKLCIERFASLPVLAIVTFRPEFELPFQQREHTHVVELTRLAPSQVNEMVRGLGGGKHVPESVLSQIADRTDGVPLFVEELTKSLLESGELVERNDDYVIHSALERLTVPASLHDSLMARLDRHHAQREVAQIASCIGREFSHHLLEQVADLPGEALVSALAQLEDAELLFAQDSGNARRYMFKHALVRDAAYESLLKRRREELHGRILEVLSKAPEVQPEVLAFHAIGANLPMRAIELSGVAAKVALTRAAFAEAVAHLSQALESNSRLPDTRSRQEQRIDLLLALGQATIPLRGYSHSTTVRIFASAHDLAEQLGDGRRLFWADQASWGAHYVRGEHEVALRIAIEMFDQADRDRHDGRLLTALRARGISEMITGVPAVADATFVAAEKLANRMRQQTQDRRIAVAQRFAADPEIATQFHVALTHWSLGRTEHARSLTESGIAAARAMGHVHTLGHALTHSAIIAVVDHDAAAAIAFCEETAELASLHDMDLWRGYGDILHGFALVLASRFEEATRLLGKGLAVLGKTETATMVPVHRAVYAFGLARLGDFDEARRQEHFVLRELSDGSERYYRTETLLWLGRYRQHLRPSDASDAETLTLQAVDEARRQNALGWEVRAATAVGHLWLERGEREAAIALLSPLSARLPPGCGSRLRLDAEDLLDAAAR